jgi:hypothetical protein
MIVVEELTKRERRRRETARDRMPAAESWLIISPSEAFLPPTCSTSRIRKYSNAMTRCCSAMPLSLRLFRVDC